MTSVRAASCLAGPVWLARFLADLCSRRLLIRFSSREKASALPVFATVLSRLRQCRISQVRTRHALGDRLRLSCPLPKCASPSAPEVVHVRPSHGGMSHREKGPVTSVSTPEPENPACVATWRVPLSNRYPTVNARAAGNSLQKSRNPARAV